MGKPVLLVAAGLSVVLAGCGGRRQAEPPLTKAAFVAAASAICAQATTRSGRVARLRALRPPLGDEELYRRWLNAEEDALAAAEELVHPSGEPEPEGDPLVPLAIAEGKIAGYARRLGTAACVTMPG